MSQEVFRQRVVDYLAEKIPFHEFPNGTELLATLKTNWPWGSQPIVRDEDIPDVPLMSAEGIRSLIQIYEGIRLEHGEEMAFDFVQCSIEGPKESEQDLWGS